MIYRFHLHDNEINTRFAAELPIRYMGLPVAFASEREAFSAQNLFGRKRNCTREINNVVVKIVNILFKVLFVFRELYNITYRNSGVPAVQKETKKLSLTPPLLAHPHASTHTHTRVRESIAAH